MNAEIKEVIQILSAALAPVTAVVALGIAYRQHRLESVKFRHQLYERRLAVFTSTMNLLSVIIQDADIQLADLFKFLQETNQSYFLLGKDLTEYLTEIYEKGLDLHSQNKRLHHSNLPVGEERTRLAEKNGELLKWFCDQVTVAREKFSKHLALDK